MMIGQGPGDRHALEGAWGWRRFQRRLPQRLVVVERLMGNGQGPSLGPVCHMPCLWMTLSVHPLPHGPKPHEGA